MAKEPSANQMVRLNKIIPALDASYGEGGAWTLTGEWVNYSRFGGVDIPYWQGFIDLGGYTRQNDLTFYIDDRALLDPGPYRSTIGQAGSPLAYNFFVEMITVVTSGPVDPILMIEEFITNATSPSDGNPGYGDSTLDWLQVILGNNTVLAVDEEVGGQALLTKLRNTYFGSGEPTNANRLYITRFLVVSEASDITDSDILRIPACRVVLRGIAFEEEEYIRIMRMYRSYELAQS